MQFQLQMKDFDGEILQEDKNSLSGSVCQESAHFRVMQTLFSLATVDVIMNLSKHCFFWGVFFSV